MSASPNAIEVDGVWKLYTRDVALAKGPAPAADSDDPGAGRFWALRDVTFNVRRGEVVGLIGANGAGKSTLLKIMSRITAPTRGQVRVNGSIVSLLEVGTGFHEELSGRENIKLNATILGMAPDDLESKFDDIVEFSGIEQFIDMPVKHLSSGMRVRLGFSIAVHVAPDILIVDEILAVGDAEFQDKCRRKVAELVQERDRTVLIVSHSMGSIDGLCSRAVMLEEGRIARDGDPSDVIDTYLAASGEKRKISRHDPDADRRNAEKTLLREQRAAEKAAKLAAAAERDLLKRQAAERAALEKQAARMAAEERQAAKAAALERQSAARAELQRRHAEEAARVAAASGGPATDTDAQHRAALMQPIWIGDGVWDLRSRIDRGGSGRVLLERLTMLKLNGARGSAIAAGGGVRFVLTYLAADDALGLRSASFSIVIVDERGEPIFWLPSSAAYGDELRISPHGEVSCDVPELPLLPGKYGVNVWMQIEGERSDRIINAAQFEVEAAPVFSTGVLQSSRNGPVLVRHTWSIADAEDPSPALLADASESAT